MYSEMLKILEPGGSFTPQDAELNLDREIWTCIAHVRLHHYKEAEEGIAKASQSCLDASRFVCGELFNARGSLEELIDDLNVCEDESYLPSVEIESLKQQGWRVHKILNGYMRWLRERKQGAANLQAANAENQRLRLCCLIWLGDS